MNDTLAGASPVDQPVRPLSARLDVLRVLLAARHPEHHATVAEAHAEVERLRAALTLAANRLDVLALDHDYGTTRRNITDDWAKEARAALGPNVLSENENIPSNTQY